MIYKLRMVSNEVEDFFRDFEIRDDQTFLELHNAIQEELGFDAMQMASFYTSNENWDKGDEITLMDMGSGANVRIMESTTINDLITNNKDRLLYVFDMLNERAFFIECCGSKNNIEGKEYPCCEQSAGRAPKQIDMIDNEDDFLNIDPLDEELLGKAEDIKFESLDNIENMEELYQ